MSNLDLKQKVIVIIVGIIIVSVIIYYFYTVKQQEEDTLFETISNNKVLTEEKEELIIVHIAGEVANPGIVRIKNGARIADIIEQAGGLKQEADISNINLAYPVEDGQKIKIPKKGEEENEEYITEKSGQDQLQETINKGGKSMININKATIEELQELPGIGEQTAQKIIDYRKENGEFKQIEDLKNVSGIGEAKYEKIKDKIRIK